MHSIGSRQLAAIWKNAFERARQRGQRSVSSELLRGSTTCLNKP